jgi:hypothetical protein
MNTADTVSPAIREFATAVRAALDDLSAEEVEDLTDGLEADLSEQARDAGDEFAPGDPVAYSEELRTSAGLGPRTERRQFQPIARLKRLGEDATTRARSTAVGSALLDFALALRPAWWLLRAWVLFHLVAGIVAPWNRPALPQSLLSWLALLGLVVVSVQWGRGRWLGLPALPVLKVIASILAVIALPAITSTLSYNANHQADEYSSPQGLTMHGQEVRNIFAYDADGEPLENVQLFTQDGDPLITAWDADNRVEYVGQDERGNELNIIPNPRAGKSGWGVYPLFQVKTDDLDLSSGNGALFDGSDVIEPMLPFERARPLAADPNAEKASTAEKPDSRVEEPSASPSPSPVSPPVSP